MLIVPPGSIPTLKCLDDQTFEIAFEVSSRIAQLWVRLSDRQLRAQSLFALNHLTGIVLAHSSSR